jgi:DNA-directed RNA polymerase subunit E'/Rpb7
MTELKEGGKQENDHNLYARIMLEMKAILLPMQIGQNKTEKNLQQIITSKIEGKCIQEGYVQPNSVKILSYSAGLVKTEYIEFNVVFECKTCNPVEGTILYNCVCTSVTKGGIHADIYDKYRNIPATVYIHRDHFAENRLFQSIEKQSKFDMRVIGVRFELNDPCVEIIGEIWGTTTTTITKK